MLRQPLESANWTVRAVNDVGKVPSSVGTDPIPARVPGCVHTDLVRADKIPDPYYDRNEAQLQWIGLTDWQYRCTFDADPKLFDHERIDLACDGLDTVARVELNGTLVGESFNMHHPHRFDVRRALKKGANELVITFASPVKYANAMRDKLGDLPRVNGVGGPFNFIRKMACNFGWDWGPAVVTSGVWRAVSLEAWSSVRIAGRIVRVISATQERATLAVEFHREETVWNWSGGAVLLAPNGIAHECKRWEMRDSKDVVTFEIEKPLLWWPCGNGQQPLYELKAEYVGERHSERMGQSLDRWSGRIGLRTVELDASPDDIGRKFVVKVNGKPIFCKGFNWIPDDCFLDRACDPLRYRKRIQQALDANCNMLRVWGGRIYETDEFYDICDEMGMLVWQDFLFACAGYPEEEPIRSQVEAEARHNVARLSRHPSLVLWNGCNENVWGYRDWGWQKKGVDPKRTWGPGYYFDLLPKIVNELDPSRPYWPASPWSGDRDLEHGLHPNLDTHGNQHIWQVWHGPGEYTNYRNHTPRFCSEFGYQGPPDYSTFARAIPPEQRHRGSESLLAHQKSPGGNERNDRLLALHFDIPENFDDWQFLLQLNQARALQTGVEWFRSRQPTCMGTLIWQLNDCWPVTSWSAIDSDGRPKLLWYAARRFFAPRLLTIQPEGDALVLFANNDSDEPWTGEALVRRIRFDGAVQAEFRVSVHVAARQNGRAATLPREIAMPNDGARELIVAQLDVHRAEWFYELDKNLLYPDPRFDAKLERTKDGYALQLTGQSLLHDVCVFADRIDDQAQVSDQMLTLLPGETATIQIATREEMTVEQLARPPVLQCASRFGKAHG